MAQKAKSGNIRTGVDLRAFGHGLRCVGVQPGHRANQTVILLRLQQVCLGSGGQDAGAEGFGQNQRVSRSGAHVSQSLAWMDIAGDAQAVFRLIVLNGVAPGDDAACLHRFLVAALQNFPDGLLRETAGDAQQVHGHGGPPPHGVHVTEGVGRGDLPEPEGVIHNRGEEIHGMNGGDLVGNAVNTGVVAGVKAH